MQKWWKDLLKSFTCHTCFPKVNAKPCVNIYQVIISMKPRLIYHLRYVFIAIQSTDSIIGRIYPILRCRSVGFLNFFLKTIHSWESENYLFVLELVIVEHGVEHIVCVLYAKGHCSQSRNFNVQEQLRIRLFSGRISLSKE